MDYTDVNCQKRLIKTFVNSVFVYDDKVVLTFNYSGDNRTMTLKEIDAGLQQGVRIPETNAYHMSTLTLIELAWTFFIYILDFTLKRGKNATFREITRKVAFLHYSKGSFPRKLRVANRSLRVTN